MSECNFTGVVAQKAALYVKDPVTKEWLFLAGLSNFNGPQTTINEIDATTLCDDAMRYLPGLPDNGTFTATAQVLFGNPAQWLLTESMANNPPDTFDLKLRIPDDGYGNGEVWGYGKGFCNGFPIEGSVGQIITGNISFRLTGPWTWERPTAYEKKLRFSTTTLNESGANNGRIASTITVGLEGDAFDGTDGQALAGVTFTATPDGLTAVCTKINNTTARIAFNGVAVDHDEGLIDTVQVKFGDSAFVTGPAADILNNDQLININWI